jgi:hypothetical protein
MCTISNRLRLCTCNTGNIEELKHYWILKRPNGGNECMVGEALLPANIGKDTDRLNMQTLRKMLNAGNCFDVELRHQKGDILELHFTLNEKDLAPLQMVCHGNYLAYAFVFKNGRWRKTEYDPFGTNLEDVRRGRIEGDILI